MPHKNNAPGGCCCACEPGTYSAATPDDWTNLDDWESSGPATNRWIPLVDGAAIFLARTDLVDDDNLYRMFCVHIHRGSSWRIVWDWVDADNYQFVQMRKMAAPAGQTYGYLELVLGYVVAGVETVVTTGGKPPPGIFGSVDWDPYDTVDLLVELCISGPEARIGVDYGYDGVHYDAVIGWPTMPAITTGKSGVLAVTNIYDVFEDATDYLVSGTAWCDDAQCGIEVCSPCNDFWGPDQMQVVIAGFTGAFATINGTYILDAQRWRSQYVRGSGGAVALYQGCYWIYDVAGTSVVLQITANLYGSEQIAVTAINADGWTGWSGTPAADCVDLSNQALGFPQGEFNVGATVRVSAIPP